MFQYPLVDRVGFEGTDAGPDTRRAGLFQYPLVDRVGFEGEPGRSDALVQRPVSVSSGGSSWF